MTDTPSMGEILALKQPNRKSVDIPLNSEIAQQISDKETLIEQKRVLLDRERNRERTGVGKSLAESSKISQLTRAIEELEDEIDTLWEANQDTIATFTFQDIGRKKYDDLTTAHPPTKEQQKDWEEEGGEGKLGYNPDTFVPALISVTAISPAISLDEATKICEEWGNYEVIRLFNAALAACVGTAAVPKSRRSLTDTAETTNTV